MNDQVTYATADEAVAQAALAFVGAERGRYDALCIAVVGATLLAKERNAANATMSADWCGARIADKFEGALVASGEVSPKTAANYSRTVHKAVRFTLEGFANSGGLYTVDYTKEIVEASLETLPDFKRNLRDIDAALTEVLRKGPPKEKKAKTAQAVDGVAALGAEANETAKASEKVANAVKTLAALIQEPENYGLFLTEEVDQLVAAILRIKRDGVAAEQPEQGEAPQAQAA